MELLWCCSINKLNILLSLGWYGRHPSLLGDHCGHAILHQHRFGHRPLCWLFSSYRTCFHRLQRYVFNTKLGNFTTTYLPSAWVLNVVFGRQIYSSVMSIYLSSSKDQKVVKMVPPTGFFSNKARMMWCCKVKNIQICWIHFHPLLLGLNLLYFWYYASFCLLLCSIFCFAATTSSIVQYFFSFFLSRNQRRTRGQQFEEYGPCHPQWWDHHLFGSSLVRILTISCLHNLLQGKCIECDEAKHEIDQGLLEENAAASF